MHLLRSGVIRKVIMALTGLALVGFVITHLLGNLLLYLPGGQAFNLYAHKLTELGPLIWVAEVGLVFLFLSHAINGVCLTIEARCSKPIRYENQKSKGGQSKYGLSSNSMAITGSVLFLFVILHVWHFKFGPGIHEGYSSTLNGVETRDLYRHVLEQFKRPIVVLLYVITMIFLGTHLKHGIWSAFQSMGWIQGKWSNRIERVGHALAIIFAIGFLGIPIYLYFFGVMPV